MAFAAIFVPHFPVQAVVRVELGLRGHAVALVEGAPPLVKVAAANDAARRAGVEPGMNKINAAHFSGVEIRLRSAAQEQIAHAALLDLGWSMSPRIEDTARDTVTIDIAGLASFFGNEEQIAAQLSQRAAECGFNANVAAAGNMETACVAAMGYAGITVIARGEEGQRLSALPVRTLLPSEDAAEILERWGVRTCGALAALPVRELSQRLGQEGVRLHALARGGGERTMSVAEPVYLFEEEMELEDAVGELEPLSFLLGRLLDQLCARLEARSQAASAIEIYFDLEPAFEKAFDSKRELERSNISGGTYRSELRVPSPSRHPKMLLQLLRLRLQGKPPGAPILKIRMTAEAGRPRATQSGLFLPAYPDIAKLEITLARLANIVGADKVGSPQPGDTHRPGHFQMRAFATPKEMRKTVRGRIAGGAGGAAAMFRVFRPALPANLEIQEGRPVRVFFQGTAGVVLSASGPWRTSGEWWRDDRWEQDEWDLEVVFSTSARPGPRTANFSPAYFPIECAERKEKTKHGLYQVFYDAQRQGWFVRGCYD
ncbi:MAG: DNA polymerase Y family protein [Candidatus Acidiferrales bacterium]